MKIRDLTRHTKRTIFRIASSILLCAALCCDLMMISSDALISGYSAKSFYVLSIALYLLAIFELSTFLFKRELRPDKFDYAHCAYAAVLVLVASLSWGYAEVSRMMGIVGFLYMLVPIGRRITSIVRNHTRRNVIKQAIFLALLGLYSLGILLFFDKQLEEMSFLANYMVCAAVFMNCIINVCRLAVSNFNYEVLRKIVRKTYAGEIVFGLLLLIVAFSLVFVRTEIGVDSFVDALWYCFAVVTTIGFGDFVASSILGRVLSVILGVYGLIVVAIVTSIIVNFYNEIKNTDDEEQESVAETNLLDEGMPQEESAEPDKEEPGQEEQPAQKEPPKESEIPQEGDE